jgi:transcriptional regulator with XRE-family HTH domain
MKRPAPKYGRGSGLRHPVDVHVGGRVRLRRRFLGMTQENLADHLAVTFQQMQKYEAGANRVSASRLAAIAHILKVPIRYFFADLPEGGASLSPAEQQARERLEQSETLNLVRFWHAIADPQVRAQYLALVKAVAEDEPSPKQVSDI